MASRGLAAQYFTGNRIRDTLVRTSHVGDVQVGVLMPGEKNPVKAVRKYKEPAPEISYPKP